MRTSTNILRWSANCRLSSMLILYVLLLCSFYAYCEARDTLRQGEWITDNGETLVSAGGKFEFGFFSPIGSSGNKRYVGIWYHEWDNRTVVWVANRDYPINNANGVFNVTEDGELKALDTTGKEYWSAYIRGSTCPCRNRTLTLNNSGNLVFGDFGQHANLWESFNTSTHTLLPGMDVNQDSMLSLISWKGSDDPGEGSFSFYISGSIYKDFIIYCNRFSSDQMDAKLRNLSRNFAARIVMDFSGKLQYWRWDVKGMNWSLIMAEPDNKCNLYNYCGNYGVCDPDNNLVCKCLPGFKPNAPEKWHSGDFSNGCARSSVSCGENDMFFPVYAMSWDDTDSNLKPVSVKDESAGKTKCLKRCDCRVYSYDNDTNTCYILTQDPVDLREYAEGNNSYSVQSISVRVAISDIESAVQSCEPCGINMIPYPLSTGPSCGDPNYFSFNCNTTSGQVSFIAPSGTYRVASIDPDTRSFLIQVNDSGNLRFNHSLPFDLTSPRNFSSEISTEVIDEVEIVWEPPLEPICNSSAKCNDWSHSTCKSARDGKRRCLCTFSYRWDGAMLKCRKEKWVILLLIIGITSVSILCAVSSVYVWYRNIAKRQENRKIDQRNRTQRMLDSEDVQALIDLSEFKEEDEEGIDVPFFDLESMLIATNNFSNENKLGEGGYGPVYKGKLPNGQEIAVKRLSSVSSQGLQEFKNEVVLIARLQHRNLVKLYGYCIKGTEKILLYEYMPNKSLDFFIFDQKQSILLDWEMRFNIIWGIARGLLYLHHDSRLRVIHRDLKTSNILLDQKMNPKISDFGLARIVGGTQTEANTTKIVGTYGYISPEYALEGIFSVKSDVFSFGVVLLEIISGKKNTSFYQSEQAMSLLGYAWRLWTDKKVLDLMDETLQDTCIANQFVKCVNIGLLCVQENPGDRPTMMNVIKMFDIETVNLPTPKRPAFFIGRDQSKATSSDQPESNNVLTNTLEGR
uniref:non-specific serine/threonine protein kinase n=2 Tax=Quercus lobata TaxID=97700 RepID=A0A7N2LSH3_QUELO